MVNAQILTLSETLFELSFMFLCAICKLLSVIIDTYLVPDASKFEKLIFTIVSEKKIDAALNNNESLISCE